MPCYFLLYIIDFFDNINISLSESLKNISLKTDSSFLDLQKCLFLMVLNNFTLLQLFQYGIHFEIEILYSLVNFLGKIIDLVIKLLYILKFFIHPSNHILHLLIEILTFGSKQLS